MARNKMYRNMRVLLRPGDMRLLSELRDGLQKLEGPGAPVVNDSDAVRKAIGLAHGLIAGGGMRRGPSKPLEDT